MIKDNYRHADKTLKQDSGTLPGNEQFLDLKRELGIKSRAADNYYTDFAKIGAGGIGIVKSARDPNLGREIALKILHPAYKQRKERVERFIREARATAQLEHPNIIPVHEMGVSHEDGVFFTMKRVQGKSLGDIISSVEFKDEGSEIFTRERLLEIFIDICQGVAFAHSKGIIHRDLKPENVLVGEFGEVLVLDWGLVRYLGEKEENGIGIHESETVQLDLDDHDSRDLTIDGTISGTPNYMPPEQAMGKSSEMDERSDIYSLGAILYQILTYSSPYDEADVATTLNAVARGSFIPPRKRAPKLKIPRELESICLKAMSHRKDDRYQSARELIRDIRNYMEGCPVSAHRYMTVTRFWKLCVRHPVISSTAAAAGIILLLGFGTIMLIRHVNYETLMNNGDFNREEGNLRRNKALELYQQLKAKQNSRVVKQKCPEESSIEKKLSLTQAQFENSYELAMMLYSRAPQIKNDYRRNEAIAEIFRKRIDYSIKTGNYTETEKWLMLLEQLLENTAPEIREEAKREIDMAINTIRGDGYISIITRPEECSISMRPAMNSTDPQRDTQLGNSPIENYRIAKGSYIFTLKSKNRPELILPVNIDHGAQEHIKLLIPDEIPEDMAYVPAGSSYIGGEKARTMKLQKVDLPGFFIKKHEISFAEYIEFWLTLSETEREKHMSRIRLERNVRAFHNAWDENGKLRPPLRPELPLVGITRESANAYCQWKSRQLGRLCRLPTANEWEKAARGVDGREYVWGNEYQADYAFTVENRKSHAKFGFLAPPGSHPEDVSVYGIFDLGGNVREWTDSKFYDDSPFYQIKGASSSTTKRFLCCAYASDTPVVPSDVGFRYIIPITEEPIPKR